MNQKKSAAKFACPRCTHEIAIPRRFCPECGHNLYAVPLIVALRDIGPKQLFSLLVLVLALYGTGVGLREWVHWHRGDVKPTAAFSPPQQQVQATAPKPDPELDALRTKLEKTPNDLETLRSLTVRLADRFRESPTQPPELVFEAIDALSNILKQVPGDPEALLMMADISFDQRAFTKAKDFYVQYLETAPDDLGARSRYASTLTFLRDFDGSIRELTAVLKKDPNNFPAMAYLAITYSEKGDKEKARELAMKALDIAPSDEARARFSGFIQSLDEGDSGVGPVRGSSDPLGAFVESVRNNPVAGPKFVRSDGPVNGTLTLIFRDFPMEAMPPFAKEKFFTGLRSKLKESGMTGVAKIRFVEENGMKELEIIDVPG